MNLTDADREINEKTMDRIRKRTVESGGCQLVTMGNTNRYGIPIISHKGKGVPIQRFVYQLVNDVVLPHGVPVYRNCGNANCWAPSHLTRTQPTDQAGEKNGRSTMSDEKREEIRASFGEGSANDRAKRFGTTKNIVWAIDRVEFRNTAEEKAKTHAQKLARKNYVWTSEDFEKLGEKIIKCSSPEEVVKPKPEGCPQTKCRIWWGPDASKKQTLYDGYGRVFLIKSMGAHKAACSAKNGRFPIEGEVTRHLCGRRDCVAEDHLTFGTQTENGRDALVHGNNPNTLLDFDKAKEVRALWVTGEHLQTEIALMFEVDANTIFCVVHNKTWVDTTYVPPEKNLNWKKVREIRKRVLDGERPVDIAPDYNINAAYVSQLVTNRKWNDPDYTPPQKTLTYEVAEVIRGEYESLPESKRRGFYARTGRVYGVPYGRIADIVSERTFKRKV